MPDVELEPLDARPDATNTAITELAEAFEPMAGQRGDVNWLCGHCRAIIVKGIRADIEPLAPPPGPVFSCPKCGKYNLRRMSFAAYDKEFANG